MCLFFLCFFLFSLQDQTTHFSCKTFFAREFDTLRTNFIVREGKTSATTSESDSEKNKKFSCKRNQSQPDLEAKTNFDRKLSGHCLTPNSSTKMDFKEFPQQMQENDDIRYEFARSLSKSAKWEARGGKSGSNFCKTLGKLVRDIFYFNSYRFSASISDDRFVLKEMSIRDVNIFENFAPNYFVYVNNCLQKSQPTLLAKIFGVFKITIKKKE